jgi:predicted MPP superfamily phosphohydrolase
MTTVRIVHMSDLHAAKGSAFDQERIAAAALEDLERAHAQRAVDLLVFSGDLAFAGPAEEFELGEELLLEPARERLGLSRTQTVLVPGNHDVDRRGIVDFVEEGLISRLTSRESVNAVLAQPADLELATERLRDWKTFHREYYGADEPVAVGGLGFAHHIAAGQVTVGVAALNSSWRASGGDADQHRLLVGDRQIEPVLAAIADADVEVVVMHHPLDWLAPFDSDRVHQYLEARRALVFSGHEHVAEPAHVATRHGSAIYARAGCLYEKHGYPNTYAIVDIDLSGSEVTIRTRAWYPNRETGVFDAATAVAPEGSVSHPWIQGSSLTVRPATAVVAGALAIVAQETSVIADAFPEIPIHTVEDVLVPPRFLKAPYREAVAAASVTSGALIQS